MPPLTDIQLLDLLDKYHTGNCSASELELLQQWFDTVSEEEAAWQLPEASQQEFTAEMFEEFRNRMLQHSRQGKIRRLQKAMAVAASVLTVLVSTYLFYSHIQKKEVMSVQANAATNGEPGQNGALLTLADGSTIALDSAGSGTIATQNGVTVINADGQLQYKAMESGNVTIAYNTLVTPKARQYNLVLPDGTRVWLNAASSIKYPVAFNGVDRNVEITGEAYFEVSHNAKPFKVKAGSTEIIDLGTAFNVYAYNDEPALKATLLQGAIKIQDKILKPGEQAQVNGSTMRVTKLSDAGDVIAWKNGEINFEHVDVATLLRQVSRWYDVEIVYKEALPQTRLLGTISRQTNLSTIVKVLNEYGISCKIEGNKLIVAAK